MELKTVHHLQPWSRFVRAHQAGAARIEPSGWVEFIKET